MRTTADAPRTSLPVLRPAGRHYAGIDYELFLDCVHCGLCTSSCPTYVELGTEMDSPRGRIYLMRAVTDGRLAADDTEVRRHLDLCLDCRACESACPSGVQYGQILGSYKKDLARLLPAAPQQISVSLSGTSCSPGIISRSCRGGRRICCAWHRWQAS